MLYYIIYIIYMYIYIYIYMEGWGRVGDPIALIPLVVLVANVRAMQCYEKRRAHTDNVFTRLYTKGCGNSSRGWLITQDVAIQARWLITHIDDSTADPCDMKIGLHTSAAGQSYRSIVWRGYSVWWFQNMVWQFVWTIVPNAVTYITNDCLSHPYRNDN